MGVADSVIAKTLRTFAGVEHRIETVATVDGVTYINDSKGTNPDATIMAIRAMDRPTVLILGGYDKHGDFLLMFREFNQYIAHIVVLGQTQEQIVDTAKQVGYQNITLADSLADAVQKCRALASPGDERAAVPGLCQLGYVLGLRGTGPAFQRTCDGAEIICRSGRWTSPFWW